MPQNITKWEVNIDLGDRSVLSGNRPLPEPLLHKFCNLFKIKFSYFPKNNWFSKIFYDFFYFNKFQVLFMEFNDFSMTLK